MTEQEYNRVSRAAYAVRKLKDGKLSALTPQDLELVRSLLNDKDGYVEQAVAHNRPAWKATKDAERCEWAVAQQAQPAPAQSYPDTCKHGVLRSV